MAENSIRNILGQHTTLLVMFRYKARMNNFYVIFVTKKKTSLIYIEVLCFEHSFCEKITLHRGKKGKEGREREMSEIVASYIVAC